MKKVEGDTAVGAYLADIRANRKPLLTAEEEWKLGERKAKGDHDAENELVERNLRLVVSIAKRYQGHNVALADLVQSGNEGLMRAAQRFDHTKGYKFSTYATWWIKQAIERYAKVSAKIVYLPVHVAEMYWQMERFIEASIKNTGKKPTKAQIALYCHTTTKHIDYLLRLDALSLDIRMRDDGATLGMIVPDEQDPIEEVLEKITHEEQQALIEEAMDAVLNEREKRLLCLRRGLLGYPPHTLDQASEVFKVSRQRVGQIESVAGKKLVASIKRIAKRRGLVEVVG